MKIKFSILAVMAIQLCAFAQKRNVDLLIVNGKVYTVDKSFSIAEAVAIDNGKIVAVGKTSALKNGYSATKEIDARGKFIYPGFIDAHAHFLNYGLSLQRANVTGTSSWNEVVSTTVDFARSKNIQPGEWILGRGWDQNDWAVKEFPDFRALDSAFPDNPVLLTRVDGHAAIANSKALSAARIKATDKIAGGEIILKDGHMTGVLIDNAIGIVTKIIPAQSEQQVIQGLRDAQTNCFAVGLTTVVDCGLQPNAVNLIRRLQQNDSLKMRLYVMLSDAPESYRFFERNGIIKTDRLHVRSMKLYGDGALGSRGAALLEPYSDKPGHMGFLLSQRSHFDSAAAFLLKRKLQMCTHAIGDSGNRAILQVYAKYLKGKNDLRWRIEHAQVVNENDFHYFGRFNVVPSVQPTHATSDMYWAGDRLGKRRVKHAYAFKQLLKQNGWIPLGTDFPVEDISPFKTFYAAVFRKDEKGWPAGGYQVENALTRREALQGMTIWAARANFEEKEKGSIEKGKYADLMILDQDLMRANEKDILKTKVLMTFVGGELVLDAR
jgi:predicted amidohydrolase YtcJ